MKKAKLLIKTLLVLGLIAFAALTILRMVANKPEIKKRKPNKLTYLVSAEPVKLVSEPVIVNVMGTVLPVRQISLKARVGGQIVKTSDQFLPGGFFKSGQQLLKIDPADYELALSQANAQLDTAMAAYDLEQGRQQVAKREWEMLGKDKQFSEQERKLALRGPQIKQAQANVNIARSSRSKNDLNLKRTSVTAPFNCVVLQKSVDLGSNISTQEIIANLAQTDEFWVAVSVPLDQLKWITIPDQVGGKGSDVVVKYGESYSVAGFVTGLLSKLENQGLMANILISVKDPLNLSKQDDREPLLLGDLVTVDIIGKTLENVFKFDRSALRNDINIWVAVPVENDKISGYKLDIRPVSVLWRDENIVIISDSIADGEMLITSGIAAPVQDMLLRVDGHEFKFKLSELDKARMAKEIAEKAKLAAEEAIDSTAKSFEDAQKALEKLEKLEEKNNIQKQ